MFKRSLVMILAACSTTAWAADFVETVHVVSSTPIYERVSEPRQQCWNETTTAAAPQRSMGGAVVGGVAGGVLGSQVGRGSGQAAATAAGAVVGTIAGDHTSNPDSGNRSPTGAIIGGIAGGLLGNQVGGGSGRTAATAAGAIAGALIGDRMANPDAPQTRQVQHCRQVENYHEEISGYNVVYRYHGREITTRLPYRPGRTIQVGVSLSVLDNGYAPPPPPNARNDNYRRDRGDRRDYRGGDYED